MPFEVELAPSLVAYLQEKGVASANARRHTVESVTYAGDEGGGIMCRIITAGTDEMLIVSLTQVKIPLSLPIGLSVLDYQRRRAKNLKKRAWTGVDYAFAKKQLEREPALCRKTFSEISEFNVYLSRSRACSYFSL